jgi:hypothetical protein
MSSTYQGERRLESGICDLECISNFDISIRSLVR